MKTENLTAAEALKYLHENYETGKVEDKAGYVWRYGSDGKLYVGASIARSSMMTDDEPYSIVKEKKVVRLWWCRSPRGKVFLHPECELENFKNSHKDAIVLNKYEDIEIEGEGSE